MACTKTDIKLVGISPLTNENWCCKVKSVDKGVIYSNSTWHFDSSVEIKNFFDSWDFIMFMMFFIMFSTTKNCQISSLYYVKLQDCNLPVRPFPGSAYRGKKKGKLWERSMGILNIALSGNFNLGNVASTGFHFLQKCRLERKLFLQPLPLVIRDKIKSLWSLEKGSPTTTSKAAPDTSDMLKYSFIFTA